MAIINRVGLDGKEDYIGFSFNGIHFSTLKLIRTIDGDRYVTDLLPPVQTFNQQREGADGDYYFGKKYGARTFPLSLAFDDLDEIDVRQIKKALNVGNTGLLVFDELPYKGYRVTVTGSPRLNFIPFDDNGGRVFKGEGQVEFTAFDPMAYATGADLSKFPDANKDEWLTSSGMKASMSGYNVFKDGAAKLFNPGDFPVGFQLTFTPTAVGQMGLYMRAGTTLTSPVVGSLLIDKGLLTLNTSYTLDTTLHLLYPTNNKQLCKNDAIIAGDFMTIPLGESILQADPVGGFNLTVVNGSQVRYTYKYL